MSQRRSGAGAARPSSSTRSRSGPRSRGRDSAPARTHTTARQATRRREAGQRPTAARRRRRSGRLTRRAAVLALVVCALVLSLAYPLKQYLAQRSQISQLEQANAQKQKQVDDLSRRKQQLQDPDYVKMLARQRLQFVIPGEMQFVIVDKGQSGNSNGSGKSGGAAGGQWYSKLWGSVQTADRAP
jgi:cell division protein FtsB